MAKKTWDNIQKSISETPITSNQQPESELWLVLKGYASLIQKYWKEIVESALRSLEIIWQFLGKSLDEKSLDMIEGICERLFLCQDKDKYISYLRKWFGSDAAALTYVFTKELSKDKIRSSFNEKNLGMYDCLKKYLCKDSKCADLFCWLQSGRESSVYWTALIFSLFGIHKVLAVDLFNQKNKIEPYDRDYFFNWKYLRMPVRDFIPSENIKEINEYEDEDDKRASLTLDFTLFSVKMDAYDSLKSMPDNSLDSIMINNVDNDIVQETKYGESLRSEIKRVVKNKWLVFWYWTTIWPEDVDYLFNESHGFVAFEND